MKVLFVYPNITGHEFISLGMASLSAYLKSEGFETYLMDYTFGGKVRDCVDKVKKIKPDIIGFSVRSGVFPFAVKVARELKQITKVPIVFGGVHPTVAPQECIAEESVDMICLGEGELALAELLNAMKSGKSVLDVQNFWFKRDREVIRNPVGPLVKDLDQFPMPDRGLFDFMRYCQATGGSVGIMASRGCPFTCAYCINPSLQDIYQGSYRQIRYHSVDHVLSEIRWLTETYPVRFLQFDDDIFPPSVAWLREFAEKYPAQFRLPFVCNMRVEMVNREICRLLRQCGCGLLQMGIESGSERVRQELLNRQMTNEQIEHAFAIAREAGLRVSSFNILGIPGETVSDIKETIAINGKVKPDILSASIFTPYPGTRLRALCLERGWLRTREIPQVHRLRSVVRSPYLTERQIIWYWKTFRFRVFWRINFRKALLFLLIDAVLYWLMHRFRKGLPRSLRRVLYWGVRRLRIGAR